MRKMEAEREKRIAEHNKMLEAQQKLLTTIYKPVQKSTPQNIETIRNEYDKKIENKNILITELLKKIKELTIELSDYKTGKTVA